MISRSSLLLPYVYEYSHGESRAPCFFTWRLGWCFPSHDLLPRVVLDLQWRRSFCYRRPPTVLRPLPHAVHRPLVTFPFFRQANMQLLTRVAAAPVRVPPARLQRDSPIIRCRKTELVVSVSVGLKLRETKRKRDERGLPTCSHWMEGYAVPCLEQLQLAARNGGRSWLVREQEKTRPVASMAPSLVWVPTVTRCQPSGSCGFSPTSTFEEIA
jgi:hypothetical protein